MDGGRSTRQSQSKNNNVPIPLSLRFLHSFFKGFVGTLREKSIDIIVVLFALAFSVHAGLRGEHMWELAFPWIEAACVIVFWHSVSAAYQLIKQVGEGPAAMERASPVLSASGQPVMIPVEAEVPRFCSVKIGGIASIPCVLSLMLGYLAWSSIHVVRPELATETKAQTDDSFADRPPTSSPPQPQFQTARQPNISTLSNKEPPPSISVPAVEPIPQPETHPKLPRSSPKLEELKLVNCQKTREVGDINIGSEAATGLGQVAGATIVSFTTDGKKEQKVPFPRRPKSLLIVPSRRIVLAPDLPTKVVLGRCANHVCTITVKEFADDGVIVDTREATARTVDQTCGVTVTMTVLEAPEPSKAHEPVISPTEPPISQQCQGGNCAISIGQQGGITAGTVNLAPPNREDAR